MNTPTIWTQIFLTRQQIIDSQNWMNPKINDLLKHCTPNILLTPKFPMTPKIEWRPKIFTPTFCEPQSLEPPKLLTHPNWMTLKINEPKKYLISKVFYPQQFLNPQKLSMKIEWPPKLNDPQIWLES